MAKVIDEIRLPRYGLFLEHKISISVLVRPRPVQTSKNDKLDIIIKEVDLFRGRFGRFWEKWGIEIYRLNIFRETSRKYKKVFMLFLTYLLRI